MALVALACLPPHVSAEPPAAPAELKAIPASGSHFNLTWADRSADEDGFRIERKETDGDEWYLIGEVPANTTQFQSVGCLERTGYEHRVYAYNSAGCSAPAAATGITLAAFDAPRGKIIAPITKENPRNGEGSMIKLRSGELLFVYTRYCGGHGDLDPASLAKRASADDGETWTGETILLSDGDHTVGHPGLVRLPDGRLGMSYIIIKGRGDAKTYFRTSTDEGATWSGPVEISDDTCGYVTGPHDALRLYDGNRLIQVCHGFDDRRRLVTLIYTSDDAGRTWVNRTGKGLAAPGKGINEGSIVKLSTPGHLLMFARTDTDWFWESRSADNGNTWSTPVRSNVRNPQAPAKLYNAPGTGAIVLIQNPYVSRKTKWPNGERWILASMISTDDGATWRHYRQIEYTGNERWFHYPSLLFDGRHAHLAYLDGDNRHTHQSVRYLRLPVDWLMAAD